jgi:hypothetical protein
MNIGLINHWYSSGRCSVAQAQCAIHGQMEWAALHIASTGHVDLKAVRKLIRDSAHLDGGNVRVRLVEVAGGLPGSGLPGTNISMPSDKAEPPPDNPWSEGEGKGNEP